MTNWVLSHKGLGIRSVAEVAVLYLCMRAFQLLQREGGDRDRDRLGESEKERSSGLSVMPWQRQTDCTIL